MKLTKTNIIFMVLIVWAVFSLIWMGMIIWRDFKNGQMMNAAQQGYAQAFIEIGAAAEKCQEIPLNIGENKTVTIVSVECLKQGEAPEENK